MFCLVNYIQLYVQVTLTFSFDLLNKQSLKLVLSELFNVKIVSINSYILPGKKCRLGKFSGYKNSYKRIFVVLV